VFSDGTTAKSIVGLRDIVATDQTVGGISQSTYSWWRAQVDSTSTVLTLSAIGTQHTAATIDNNVPNLHVTTRTLYESYNALLQPQQRFTDSKMADAGFQNLLFRGAPVVSDSHCPESHYFGVNLDYLHLQVHKDEDMRFEPFAKVTNQNIKVAKIYWMGILGSSNNRLHFKLSAVTA